MTKKNPENVIISNEELNESQDIMHTLIDVLAMVNDVLQIKDKGIHFDMIPSQEDGIEITWREEGE